MSIKTNKWINYVKLIKLNVIIENILRTEEYSWSF